MPTFRSAKECLDAIVARYRSLQSYADEGVVRLVAADADDICRFETRFVQPDKFRFRFEKPHPYPPLRHIIITTTIGTDGKTSYIKVVPPSGEPRLDIVEDIGMAVACATGISRGSAYTIGHLLFDTAAATAFSGWLRPRFRRSRSIDGVLCQRISGIHPQLGPYTLWFGAEDLLLRKLVHHRTRTEEVRRSITSNVAIGEEVFAV